MLVTAKLVFNIPLPNTLSQEFLPKKLKSLNSLNEPFIPAPFKYSKYKGDPDQVYDAICKTLSERQVTVCWASFTNDDWQLFARVAETEGVAPLLHWQVKEGGFKDIWPTEVREFLQTSYYKTAAQNALLFQELERILAVFEVANIPVIVLKGAALAQTIYPNPALRPMGDLDLLVKFEQVSQAIRIFIDNGYESLYVTSHHVGFTKDTNHDRIIELHYEIPLEKQNKTLLSANWFWDQKTILVTSNETQNCGTFQPNPTAQLIYLLGHLWLQHSSDRRLIWLYDLYQLITQHKDDIAWKELELTAHKAHLGSEFVEAGKELIDLFGLDIQPDFKVFCDTKSYESEEIENLRQQPSLSSTLKVMGAFDIKTQFSLLTQFIFLDKAKIINRYKPQPEWLWPIYYIFRVLDIFRYIFIDAK